MGQVIAFKERQTASSGDARDTALTEVLSAINLIGPILKSNVQTIAAVAISTETPELRMRLLAQLRSLEEQLRLVGPLLVQRLAGGM